MLLTLNDWLSFIEAGHNKEIELGLSRVQRVAEALQLEPLASTVVTVAGTNGKGSTIALMESVLLHAGLSVGCYTSPHFIRYNERVRLSGQLVSDQQLCDAFARVEIQRARLDIPLTYFEYGTLAAFVVFQSQASAQPLDVVLLEIGLGGRLDAVNIIEPDVAIVTTVALDHQDWLGDSREEIGFEKAGIYRSAKPAIYGEKIPPDSVIRQAQNIDAELMILGNQYGPVDPESDQEKSNWVWQGLDAEGNKLRVENLSSPTLPFDNASIAIQALQLLNLPISDEHIRQGIAAATVVGRAQRLSIAGKQVLLDVAHNPQAASHLVNSVLKAETNIRCVVGMLADKDIQSTLGEMASKVAHWYCGTLDVPRGQSAQQLLNYLAGFGCDDEIVEAFDSVAEAFDQAIADAHTGELIVVMGSFFTVAEVIAKRMETSE